MPFKLTTILRSIACLLTCFLLYGYSINAQRVSMRPENPLSGSMANPWNARVVDSVRNRVNRQLLPDNFPLHGKTKFKVTPRPLQRAAPATNYNNRSNGQQTLATVCYTIAGRDFLRQDSMFLYTSDPILLADGNVIVCGEFAINEVVNWKTGGFAMKTDIYGNAIWSKIYDSLAEVNDNYINFWRALELKDGSIILAGRTTNKVSGNDDFLLSKIDNNGNQIWFKTYESRFWEGFNGSGDYFELKELRQDPVSSDVYFTGGHWGGSGTITKINPADGDVIWSNAYPYYNGEHPFGIVIEPTRLLLFQLIYGSNNESYIGTTGLDKTTGDTLFTKYISQTGNYLDARLYNTYNVVAQTNGHFLLSGPTTWYYEFPAFSGTVDLFHAGVIELNNNFDFVKAYGFKNRVESNGYNTHVSLFPDGTGVFTMLDYITSYKGEAHVSIFRNDLIYHQRMRLHNNEGIPYEPETLKLPDGGYLNIKNSGDSTATTTFSKVDYHRMYSSDTASICLGVKDSATSIWHFNFEPGYREMRPLERNVFSESRPKTIVSWDFGTSQEAACQIISHCDTVSLEASADTICPGNTLNITIHKNKQCGSLVPLEYDTTLVDHIVHINDSTYTFYFRKSGSSYIKGSLMGCVLKEDSVFFTVLEARNSLDLGADTTICPGNSIKLNARSGFTSYVWQDGSGDTTFTITAAGKYYVTCTSICGASFSDTVNVSNHQPIPLSIGPDRFKCNNDTLKLSATPGFMNYTWSPDYTTSSLSGQEIIINPLKDTSYTLIAEKTPGCFAYDTIKITTGVSPVINLGLDTSICRNDKITLNAGSGFQNYTWNTGDASPTLTINLPGIYSIKAVAPNSCVSADTLELIKLYDLPQPDLGPDSIICKGQQRTLHTSGNFKNYIWNTGASTPGIQVNATGEYWLMVTDINGCKGADTTIIASIENPPVHFLGADTSICSYASLMIRPLKSFPQENWSTGSAAPFITVSIPGTYWLDATDNNNCKGRDTIIVAQKDCMTGLFVPSAFTPNGDGLNDAFKPLLFGDIKSFHFTIYNRWGEIVFDTKTPGASWNGSYKGRKTDTNVFVWICSYQLNGQDLQKKNGTLTAIR